MRRTALANETLLSILNYVILIVVLQVEIL